MRIINDYHSTNPFFNLAAEEYFLTESKEHICRFWQNENTVVIGKHQAMPAEVNTRVAEERGIQIGRRISGGGTVYHDLGNLNFTFIANNANGENLIDFKQFTQPIIDALKELDLEVAHSGRNDLLLEGYKISGNAEHLSQKLKRTMHHGTLLFNSDLDNLGAILKTPIDQFEGKFVHSKRSQVANISDYLQAPLEMDAFRLHLERYFIAYYQAKHIALTPIEIEKIQALADHKYQTEEWVIGYSPKFKFNGLFEGEPIQIFVEKGKVVGVETNMTGVNQLENAILGTYYSYPHLKEAVAHLVSDSHNWDGLCKALFEN